MGLPGIDLSPRYVRGEELVSRYEFRRVVYGPNTRVARVRRHG